MNDQPRMMNDYIHHKYNQISICVNMWKNWYQNEAVWYSSIPMHHLTEDFKQFEHCCRAGYRLQHWAKKEPNLPLWKRLSTKQLTLLFWHGVVKTIEHLLSVTEESWACSDLALIIKSEWLRQLYIFSQNDVCTAFFCKNAAVKENIHKTFRDWIQRYSITLSIKLIKLITIYTLCTANVS